MMKSENEIKKKAFGVFIILFCVYMLCFNGAASTDDEQLYAALTGSLAADNGYSALPLLGNDRLQGSTAGIEPLHSILGMPLFYTAQLTGIGTAQILFVLPALYTAFTAAAIFLILQRWGYAIKTSLISAFVYGLGTIALPYARMNFREPLAALLIMLAFILLEIAKEKKENFLQQVFYPSLSFFMVCLALLTKITTAAILPIYVIVFLYQTIHHRRPLRDKEKQQIFALSIFVVMIVVITARLLPADSMSRFTPQFAQYIRYTIPRLPHDHFWQAVAGLLFSPGKGLFVYSPILIFALVSPFYATDKKWMIGLASLLSLSAIQALIYNDNWWSITWGTRALLPVLPLVVLSASSAIERAIQNNHLLSSTMILLFACLSTIVQVGRLFTSDPAYAGWATRTAGRSIDAAMQWDIFYAPIFRYFWLGTREFSSDLIWFHLGGFHPMVFFLFISAFITLILIAFRLIFHDIRKKLFTAANVSICMILLGTFFFLAGSDTRYYTQIPRIKETREKICDLTDTDDLVLIDHYLHPFWWYYSNYSCQDTSWAGLPYLHQTAIHNDLFYPRLSSTEDLIHEKLQTGNVFLVTSSMEDSPSYFESLGARGFTLKNISPWSIEPFHIYQISITVQ